MQLTIEIPEHYYNLDDETYIHHLEDFRPQLILDVANTDWKDFAFDMAEVVAKALKDQV